MTGRLVDMAFTLGGKQRVTLEINGDFREIWDNRNVLRDKYQLVRLKV